jgi:hypothetical protein
VHSVNLTLSVSGADIYSCETALRGAGWRLDGLPTDDAGWNRFLLPPTHEWVVAEDMSAWRMAHGSNGADRSVCHLSLSIRRNWLMCAAALAERPQKNGPPACSCIHPVSDAPADGRAKLRVLRAASSRSRS